MSLSAEFPRDQWYVAAFSAEVGPQMLARIILDEPIVFYRDAAGVVTALADRCVHRRYPLSKGTLAGDQIVCGYNGFTYDRDGRCIAVPAQERIPRTARVASYPLVEQATLVWIWIGAPSGPIRARYHASLGQARRAGLTCAGWPPRRAGGPAARQPDGFVARNLPARRLHRQR